jgi:hypothetical protein
MSMYRERRKQFPKLPKSRTEVHDALGELNIKTSNIIAILATME